MSCYDATPLPEDSDEDSDQNVDEVIENMYVYRRKSLQDPQIELFWLEEKRRLLYGRDGIFSENPGHSNLINNTVFGNFHGWFSRGDSVTAVYLNS